MGFKHIVFKHRFLQKEAVEPEVVSDQVEIKSDENIVKEVVVENKIEVNEETVVSGNEEAVVSGSEESVADETVEDQEEEKPKKRRGKKKEAE